MMCRARWFVVAVLSATDAVVLSAQDRRVVPVYRFTVDYLTFAGPTFQNKERFTGDVTRNSNGTLTWSNVTHARGRELTGEFGAPEAQTYMEGFSYRPEAEATFRPDFFRGFPTNATPAKNLVWDTIMFDVYAGHLSKLTRTPFHVPPKDILMPGVGTITNRDAELTRTGIDQRDGVQLVVVHYDAFFNPLQLSLEGGVELVGRSDYWGDLWVVPLTNAVERATLYEEVVGEVRVPGQQTPVPINVFRRGSFDRLR